MSYPLIRRYVEMPGQKLTEQILQTNGNEKDTRGTGGTCFGDSGGPVFLNGVIVAVTSYTFTVPLISVATSASTSHQCRTGCLARPLTVNRDDPGPVVVQPSRPDPPLGPHYTTVRRPLRPARMAVSTP